MSGTAIEPCGVLTFSAAGRQTLGCGRSRSIMSAGRFVWYAGLAPSVGGIASAVAAALIVEAIYRARPTA